MARGKYSRDYRLLETFDARGRVHTDYEYIGNPWRFISGEETAGKVSRQCVLFVLAGWACFIAALLPRSGAMHSLAAALPFAFTALPLGILTDLAFSIRKMKPPLEHRHADVLNNRYPPVTLLVGLFPAFSLIAALIGFLRGAEMMTGDIVFALGALGLSAVGWFSFSKRKLLMAEEVKAS